MARKSITQNYIYNLIYQIMILILPLITTPYISRVLGAENIGIYSYTLSISAYFVLFGSLGIALYGQREIAYNQENKQKYSNIFYEVVILRFITMAISMLIFYFCFVKGKQYQIYYKILLLELLATSIDISWFFQGLEEFKKTITRNIIVKLISIVCIFVFVKTTEDLKKYFIIYVLSVLVGNISLWAYLPKYIEKINLKKLNIFKHIKPTVGLFVPQIAVQVYTVLDKTMIGTIVWDKSEVGFYEQSQKIIKILLTVVTALGTVMVPRMANVYIKNEKEQMNNYMKKSFCFMYLLAFPMIFGVIAVSDEFVPIFFGQGYDKVSMLMQIISPIILMIGMSNVIGAQYLLPTKRQKEYTISVISGAIVNFIMNSILIGKYGAFGASIGTVIAETVVTIVQIYYIKNDFNIKEILLSAKNYFIASLCMYIYCIFAGYIINDATQSLFLKIIGGMAIYFILLVVLKDEFVNEIKCKVLNKKIIGDEFDETGIRKHKR